MGTEGNSRSRAHGTLAVRHAVGQGNLTGVGLPRQSPEEKVLEEWLKS
jgi:hypothetical protein